jgi:hypothetical protein
MIFKTSSLVMSQEDAIKIAQKKGSWIGRLLVSKDLSKVDLSYFPFYKVTLNFEIESRKLPFSTKKKISSKISVLVSGTTGQASIIDQFPVLHEEDSNQKNMIEPYVPQEKVVESATKCANRFIIRRARAIPLVKSVQTELLFRPYWVAYYGEVMEVKKIHYLPIQADGYQTTTST